MCHLPVTETVEFHRRTRCGHLPKQETIQEMPWWLSSQSSQEQHDAGSRELLGKPFSLRILTDWHATEGKRDNLSSAIINIDIEIREALFTSRSECKRSLEISQKFVRAADLPDSEVRQ